MPTEFRVHDPLCRQRMQPWEQPAGPCQDCELILRVRAEERYDTDDPRKPFQDGYLIGRNVASMAIQEYAERLRRPGVTHYPGCWQDHAACALEHAAEVAAHDE
jgi:hypothetical protein